MSKFSELLAKPLPSAQNKVIEESATDDILVEEGCGEENCGTEYGSACCDPLTSSVGAVGMGTDSHHPVINTPPTPPVVVPSQGDEEVELTPDESRRVDDTINAVATPILIQDELKSEEAIEDFVESVDSDIAVSEGFLTEKTIVRFDKNAKKAQLYEVAVAACAREHKDPLYKKLETVYKMERVIKAKLRKKYHAEATKKVKEYLARAKKSKSGILSRIAHKITGK